MNCDKGGCDKSGGCGNFNCGWDFIKQGPPENLPAWFKCPAVITEKVYPVPQGAELLRITEGGRNGASNTKSKKYQCGTCGVPNSKKEGGGPPAKPKISGDCPMSKTQIQGLGNCGNSSDEKPKSAMDKIKEIFAGFSKK